MDKNQWKAHLTPENPVSYAGGFLQISTGPRNSKEDKILKPEQQNPKGNFEIRPVNRRAQLDIRSWL